MQIYVGGMYQGKLAYVLQHTESLSVTDGAVCTVEEALSAQILHHFHLFVRRLMEKHLPVSTFVDRLCSENPDCIVICDEVGCGVVPTHAFERRYRETVGRCCCRIAAKSDTVVRVTCGVGQRIK